MSHRAVPTVYVATGSNIYLYSRINVCVSCGFVDHLHSNAPLPQMLFSVTIYFGILTI